MDDPDADYLRQLKQNSILQGGLPVPAHLGDSPPARRDGNDQSIQYRWRYHSCY